VVATRNVYDLQAPIYNGEQGIVVEADPRGWMRVNLEDREVTIAGIYCLMMRHAWAVTVHRSQGSEYPAVVLAYDHRTHAPMLDRRLLYTAITRAKQHCSLVGTEQAVRTSQQGAVSFSRQTTLAYQLLSLLPHVAVGRTAAPITLPGAEAPKGGERERESRQPTEGVTGGS
jgi:exodeoxyribonuclease V alpha subunit